MKIEVMIKRVYGQERFYPINELAKLICLLLNATTLTKEKLLLCKEHGWDVVITFEEYNL